MKIGNLTGKAKLPILETLAEIAAWAATGPLDDDVVFCAETKSFFIYNEDGGGAIDIGTPYTVKKVDVYTTIGDTAIPANPAIINRTILSFEREGIGKYVGLGAPANANQIGYDFMDGSFSLFTGESFGTEWIRIIYSTEPTAV